MTTIANDIQLLVKQASLEDYLSQYDDKNIFQYDDSSTSYNSSSSSIYSTENLSWQLGHSSNYSTFEANSSYSSDSYFFPPPKAIFFNTGIDPIVTKKHYVQLFFDNLEPLIVLKETGLVTVQHILTKLLETQYLQGTTKDWTICLRDETNDVDIELFDSDKIVKIQNTIFRSMWIDERELSNAALKFKHSFKFVIKSTF